MAVVMRRTKLLVSCFLLFYESLLLIGISAGDAIPSVPKPRCIVYGMPPYMFMTFKSSHPTEAGSPSITYEGLYCHASRKTSWCRKPPFAYKNVCTIKESDAINGVMCNMTGILRDLYPTLFDPTSSQSDKVFGYSFGLLVSATRQNLTTYGSRSPCNAVRNTRCRKLDDFKASAVDKGMVQVMWKKRPSESIYRYQLHYSALGGVVNKTIYPTPSVRGDDVIVNITGLRPFTQYRLFGSCSYVAHMNAKSTGELERADVITLEEAPAAPPVIYNYEETEANDMERTVLLVWKHPPEEARNGIIRQSLIKYWRPVLSNDTDSDSVGHHVSLIVPGTKNSTLVQGLGTLYKYLITVQSCTVECGPPSEPYNISAYQELPTPSASTGHRPWVLPTFIVIAVVLVFCIVMVSICLLFKRARIFGSKPKTRQPLPNDVRPHHQTNAAKHTDVASQPILEEEEYDEYHQANV